MEKLILRIVLMTIAFMSTIAFSQDFQGKAYYQTQRKIDMKLDDSQMTAAEKSRMQAMLKKQFERTYILTFNKEASIYKEEEKLDAPSANVSTGGMKIMAIGGNAGSKSYKNTKTKKYANEQDLFGKNFLVKDDLEVYDWVLEDESKVIGKYLCFKATAKREVENLSMSFGSGDQDEESKEVEKVMETRIVTAWYTTEIPVSNGPDDYWGLPGLILELHDGNDMTFLCSKIVMNTNDSIIQPTKGKVVNQEEYQKLMEKKMMEMREQYGGRERNGEGGRSYNIRIGG